MSFFDLHAHTALKTTFQQNRMSPWDYMHVKLDFLLSSILNSQSNFDQLLKGDVRLCCIALHSIETAIAERGLMMVLAKLCSYIDQSRILQLQNVNFSNHDWEPYWEQLNKEIDTILANLTKDNQPGSIRLLRNFEIEAEDSNVVQICFSVEGIHSFFPVDFKQNSHLDKKTENEIIQNIHSLRNKYPILYITPTHISISPVCNHAFGVKIFSKKNFYPFGTHQLNTQQLGITPFGKKCLEAILSPDANGLRTLIDVKHMSLRSRKELYEFRRQYMNEHNIDSLPLLASHTGVTGLAWDSLEQQIEKCIQCGSSGIFELRYKPVPGKLAHSFFLPTSLNLYDEDIIEIVNSGGLIGITLDQRILGAGASVSAKEFIHANDVSLFYTKDNFLTTDNNWMNNWYHEEIKEEVFIGDDERDYIPNPALHLRLLCNHIVHLVSLGSKTIKKESIWEHICIGSDFDGLINAVDCCKDATCFPLLKEGLIRELQSAMMEYNMPLPKIKGIDFSYEGLVDLLMYRNGLNFLTEYSKRKHV